MAKITSFVFLLLLMFTDSQELMLGETSMKELAMANNNFAFKLHKTYRSNGNVFWSPISVFTALGVLYTGARTKTAEEIRQALFNNIIGLGDERINKGFQALIISLAGQSDMGRLEIANAVIIRSNIRVLREYKQNLRSFYSAIVKEVDPRIDSEELISNINDWFKKRTHGKIRKLLESIDYDAALILLNAVYFKGRWEKPFIDILTEKEVFYNDGMHATTVPMMVQENHFFYGNYPEFKLHALKMTYLGEKFSMIVLLPFQRNGLKQIEGSLSPKAFDYIVSRLKRQNVIVKLPRFKLEDSREIKRNLAMLGMKSGFTNNADFGGITRDASLKVSKVVHKATIEVNEHGTEATGSTGLVAVPKIFQEASYFLVDHPFLFFIRDEIKGTIIFFGRVNEL